MKDPVWHPAGPKRKDEPLPSQLRKVLEKDPEAHDWIGQIVQSESCIITIPLIFSQLIRYWGQDVTARF